MALIVCPSRLLTKKPNLLLHTHLLPSPAKPIILSIKSQDSSTELPKPTIATHPTDDGSSSVAPSLPQKPTSPALGFGSSVSPSAKSKVNPVSTKKKQRDKGERASINRREPVGKPGFVSRPEEAQQAKEQTRSESAFLLAWLGLGAVIIVEGIALAASGFLPEDWDKFFVKYLYPSFTPTVFLFVAGTVAYGVLKYLQNEKLKSQK